VSSCDDETREFLLVLPDPLAALLDDGAGDVLAGLVDRVQDRLQHVLAHAAGALAAVVLVARQGQNGWGGGLGKELGLGQRMEGGGTNREQSRQ